MFEKLEISASHGSKRKNSSASTTTSGNAISPTESSSGAHHLHRLLVDRASSPAHQMLLVQLQFYLCLQLWLPFISSCVRERGGPQVHQAIHTRRRGRDPHELEPKDVAQGRTGSQVLCSADCRSPCRQPEQRENVGRTRVRARGYTDSRTVSSFAARPTEPYAGRGAASSPGVGAEIRRFMWLLHSLENWAKGKRGDGN
jgi:hypothetical protein